MKHTLVALTLSAVLASPALSSSQEESKEEPITAAEILSEGRLISTKSDGNTKYDATNHFIVYDDHIYNCRIDLRFVHCLELQQITTDKLK